MGTGVCDAASLLPASSASFFDAKLSEAIARPAQPQRCFGGEIGGQTAREHLPSQNTAQPDKQEGAVAPGRTGQQPRVLSAGDGAGKGEGPFRGA